LKDGQQQLTYKETETVSGGKFEVPEMMTITAQIFAHTSPVDMNVILRTRREQYKLFFVYKFQKLQQIIDKAVNELVTSVEAETKLPVLYVNALPSMQGS